MKLSTLSATAGLVGFGTSFAAQNVTRHGASDGAYGVCVFQQTYGPHGLIQRKSAA